VFDHFVEDNHCNIVMDYAEGGTLHNKIKFQSELSVPFDQSIILNVFSQVASALYECKRQKVIHRDINPSNLFITKEGQVKLAGFTFSCSLNYTSQLASTYNSSPLYQAPETAKDQPYSFPADIWSFDCVIYELMTFKHRFVGKNLSDLVPKIIKGDYPPLKGNYSSNLKQTVNKMLTVDVKKRITIDEIYDSPSFSKCSHHSISHNSK
jgi:NIMA (never in mitosis gene a)-related kinase